MSSTRQLRLGAFMRPASIHTGAWRYPGAWPDMNFNFAHMKRSIQALERAKFDAFFMADHMAVLNLPLDALKRSHTVWDFDLPSTVDDFPFLSDKGKHNILGGTAARLFKLPPRNEKQKENMIKYGNLLAQCDHAVLTYMASWGVNAALVEAK